MGNDARSELAQLMADITPGDLTASFFTTGGAAANEERHPAGETHTRDATRSSPAIAPITAPRPVR